MAQFIPTLEQMDLLTFLFERKYNLIMSSISVADIAIEFAKDDGLPNHSEAMIRKHLDGLCVAGLAGYGVKIGNTYTYYVTKAGIAFLKEATGLK